MNIAEQRERWIADGSPPVPTLVIGGVPHVLQHPGQSATLLGYDPPPSLRDALQVAWDVDAVAHAFLELAESTPWDLMIRPIPGFGRTPLALTVDALVGITALTRALGSGWFHWPGNPETGELGDRVLVAFEAAIVASIGSRADLLDVAVPRVTGWRDAIDERAHLLRTEPERPMRAPRGDLTLVELLEAQRLHAAQHYRQATTSIAAEHAGPALDLATLEGLELPAAVY